jgi:hypothetical protein
LIDIIFQKNLLNLAIKKKIKFIARIKSTSNAVDKFNIYLEDQKKKLIIIHLITNLNIMIMIL